MISKRLFILSYFFCFVIIITKADECIDDENWVHKPKKGNDITCASIPNLNDKDKKKICKKAKGTDGQKAKKACPQSCGKCKGDDDNNSCDDSADWSSKKDGKTCSDIASLNDKKKKKECKKAKGTDGTKAKKACPKTCGQCTGDSSPTKSPVSRAPTETPAPTPENPLTCKDRDCKFVKKNDLCHKFGGLCPVSCKLNVPGCRTDSGGDGDGGGNRNEIEGGDGDGGGNNIFTLNRSERAEDGSGGSQQ